MNHSVMAQVFVVVAAGSVIAFIIRDMGDPTIAGWIIQVLCSLPKLADRPCVDHELRDHC